MKILLEDNRSSRFQKRIMADLARHIQYDVTEAALRDQEYRKAIEEISDGLDPEVVEYMAFDIPADLGTQEDDLLW